jgi:hypothetical protein
MDAYEVKLFVPLAFTNQPISITYIKKNGLTYDPSSNSNSGTILPPSTLTPGSIQILNPNSYNT